MAANFIVGYKECTVNKIIQFMRSASDFDSFHEKWSDIAVSLETPRELVKRLQIDYINLSKINLSYVVCELLEDWSGRKANHATLPKLIQILKQEGLHGCAELLRYCFDQLEENNKSMLKITTQENQIHELKKELEVAKTEIAKLNNLLKAAKDFNDNSANILKLKTEELIREMEEQQKELAWFKRFNKRDENGNTQLHLAVKAKNEEEVRKLVQHGALLNEKNNDGDTPLIMATNGIDKTVGLRIIKYLIDNGADPFVTNKRNSTFLHILVADKTTLTPSQFHDITVYLVSKKFTSIYSMTGWKNDSFLEVLMNIIVQKYYDMILLHGAVHKIEVQRKTLRLLFENGVDLNLVNESGDNLLMYAVWGKRSVQLLTEIVELGVNWKILNKYKRNLIHAAAEFCHVDALKYFLTLGLEVNAQDSDDFTPLHHAAYYGKGDVLGTVQCLIQNGANIATKDNSGKTALNFAENRITIKYKNNVLILLGKK